jgi:hypothetical protein
MNRIISTAVAAILIGILAVGQSATATAKTRRYSAQPWQSYSCPISPGASIRTTTVRIKGDLSASGYAQAPGR